MARNILAVALLVCGCRGPLGHPATGEGDPPATLPKQTAVAHSAQAFSLTSVPIEDPTHLERITLARREGRVEVFASVTVSSPSPRTVVHSRPFGTSTAAWTRRLLLGQLLPPPPAWDVAVGTHGAVRFVIERAEGALNRLLLVERDTTTPLRLPLGSYSDPRFFKRVPVTSDSVLLTSVLQGEQLVALDASLSGGSGSVKALGRAVGGVAIGRDGGYTVLFKERISGPVRDNSIAPGVLRLVQFDQSMQPLDPAFAPLGETTVFEIDADVVDGNLAIASTTSAGIVVVIGAADSGTWHTKSSQTLPWRAPIVSPSIVSAADGIRIAGIERAAPHQARLLVGTIDVGALR